MSIDQDMVAQAKARQAERERVRLEREAQERAEADADLKLIEDAERERVADIMRQVKVLEAQYEAQAKERDKWNKLVAETGTALVALKRDLPPTKTISEGVQVTTPRDGDDIKKKDIPEKKNMLGRSKSKKDKTSGETRMLKYWLFPGTTTVYDFDTDTKVEESVFLKNRGFAD